MQALTPLPFSSLIAQSSSNTSGYRPILKNKKLVGAVDVVGADNCNIVEIAAATLSVSSPKTSTVTASRHTIFNSGSTVKIQGRGCGSKSMQLVDKHDAQQMHSAHTCNSCEDSSNATQWNLEPKKWAARIPEKGILIQNLFTLVCRSANFEKAAIT